MNEIKDTKAYSINDFLNWFDNDELILSPKYQRNAVWGNNAKSYLIDTIIRGFPIPQIFLRQSIDTSTRKTTREIIDGQQRIRSIIEFTENRFSILPSHNNEYGKKFYDDLSEEVKEKILNYNIGVEIIKIKEDAMIYEMFARLNTNNMALNKQELRNAQFTGEFKVFVYRKSSEFKSFLINHNTFKDKEFSRMIDVDFFNSLIIHLLEGIVNDSATKFDKNYKKYDQTFERSDEIEDRLNHIFRVQNEIFSNPLFETKIFHRKNYLFTLFCALNFQISQIPHEEIVVCNDFSLQNIFKNINTIVSKLMNFEANLLQTLSEKEFLNENDISKYLNFEKYHKTRTTSIAERTERIKILSNVFCE